MGTHEQQVEYGGVSAHISTPENSTGLVFIAPGALVSLDAPLIKSIQAASVEDGRTVVIADLGQTPLIEGDPSNVHGNFDNNLRQVIDGYLEDNGYADEQFELIGHSMGGSAVLSVASEYPVSAISVLDPMHVAPEKLQDIECPVNVIISDVRSYRNPGKRMFNELSGYNDQHALHKVETSQNMPSGHIFEGQEDEVAQIIRDYHASDELDTSPDLDEPG